MTNGLNPVPICILFVITFMTAGVGGSTKKLAFGASYQLGYTVGNIIGPQTYRQSDAPDYNVCGPQYPAWTLLTIIHTDCEVHNVVVLGILFHSRRSHGVHPCLLEQEERQAGCIGCAK